MPRIGNEFKLITLIGALLLVTACSSSKSSQNPDPDSLPLDPEAGAATDAVPHSTPETLDPGMPDPHHEAVDADAAAVHEHSEPAPKHSHKHQTETMDSLTPSSMEARSDSYKVRSGETLMKIAYEVYGDLHKWKAIYELNRDQIPDPTKLRKGLALKLPQIPGSPPAESQGEKYLIKKGDTLASISTEVYGTKKKWKKILENNRDLIHDPNKIFAGFNLYYTMTPEDVSERDAHRSNRVSMAPVAPSAPGGAQPQVSKMQAMKQNPGMQQQSHSMQPMQQPMQHPQGVQAKASDGSASSIPDLAVPWSR